MIKLSPVTKMSTPISATLSFSYGNKLFNKQGTYRDSYATETYLLKLAVALKQAGVRHIVIINDGLSTCSNYTKIITYYYSLFGKMTVVLNTRLNNSLTSNNVLYYVSRFSKIVLDSTSFSTDFNALRGWVNDLGAYGCSFSLMTYDGLRSPENLRNMTTRYSTIIQDSTHFYNMVNVDNVDRLFARPIPDYRNDYTADTFINSEVPASSFTNTSIDWRVIAKYGLQGSPYRESFLFGKPGVGIHIDTHARTMHPYYGHDGEGTPVEMRWGKPIDHDNILSGFEYFSENH